jgi:hypothetical protein
VNRIRRRRGRFVNALPVGNETFALARTVAELALPAGLANVRPAQKLRPIVEEQRMERLAVGKRFAARLARRRAGLNVPIVHEPGNLTTKRTDEHEENNPRISPMNANFPENWFDSRKFV